MSVCPSLFSLGTNKIMIDAMLGHVPKMEVFKFLAGGRNRQELDVFNLESTVYLINKWIIKFTLHKLKAANISAILIPFFSSKQYIT